MPIHKLIIMLLSFCPFICLSQNDIATLDSIQSVKKVLKVAIKEAPPFTIKTENGYVGVSVDLWEAIALKYDWEYEYLDLKLHDILVALEEGTIDLAIDPLTVTSDRIHKMNFTQPFYITNLAIAAHKKEQDSIFQLVSQVFSVQFFKAILSLFVIIMFFGILVWLCEHHHKDSDFGKGWKGAFNGIWWSAVTMTTVGYGDSAPKTVLGRIISIIWMFTAVICISSLTASIASALTLQQLNADIDDLKDLKRLRVGCLPESSGSQYLTHNFIKFQDFSSLQEGLKAIQKNELDVFIYDEPLLKHYLAMDEYQKDLQILNYKFSPQYYSFAMPKSSHLMDSINPVLIHTIQDIKWKASLYEYNLTD